MPHLGVNENTRASLLGGVPAFSGAVSFAADIITNLFGRQTMNSIEASSTRILVTGGSGFIGTNLVESCIARGEIVLNLDINTPRNTKHTRYWRKIDLLKLGELRNAVVDFDPHYIYHMGARTDLDGRTVDDYCANTVGVSNLISACSGLRSLKRTIFASSRLVCNIGYQPKDEFDYSPTTPYGESKVIGEHIVRNSNGIPCSWLIVRPTSIWGPWFDIPYKTFFITVARGVYFHPGTRVIHKSFGYMGNTVHQLHRLMDAKDEIVAGKTFFLQDYPPTNLSELANCIQETMGARKIRSAPLIALRFAAIAGDALKAVGWKNPPITRFRLNNLLTDMTYDSRALEAIVGPLPYSMQRGVIDTVAWMCRYDDVRNLPACRDPLR